MHIIYMKNLLSAKKKLNTCHLFYLLIFLWKFVVVLTRDRCHGENETILTTENMVDIILKTTTQFLYGNRTPKESKFLKMQYGVYSTLALKGLKGLFTVCRILIFQSRQTFKTRCALAAKVFVEVEKGWYRGKQ